MCCFFFSTKTPLFSLQNVVCCSDMSSIITSVFSATIGWLVNKGRDVTAERLKEGDVADQKIRDLIVREVEDIKSKLEGLSRKDLLTAVDSFQTGIRYLFEAFDVKPSSQANVGITDENLSEHDLEEAMKTVSVAAEMGKLEKKDFNETMKNFFFQAKKRFETARNEATKASNNEALKIFDRITAIRYRVMATVLESVVETVGAAGDMSPSSLKTALNNALPECEECLHKLHSLPAVPDNFKVELGESVLNVRGRYGKEERRKIISTVCQVNRAIYHATRAVGRDTLVWPFVDTGEDKVDPLRDGRISKVLHKVNMEHCCLLWSFGQEGTKEHKLKFPRGIAKNIKGQFLIADYSDKTVKVFDSNGKFDFSFSPQTYRTAAGLTILDVAAGEDQKIYLLIVTEKKTGAEECREVQVFNESADLQHKFPVRRGYWSLGHDRLIVISGDKAAASSGKQSGKILVKTELELLSRCVVDVHEPSGEFVCSFKEFTNHIDISATCDGRVMILDRFGQRVYVFDVEGHQLGKFDIKSDRHLHLYRIACHPSGEYVVLAGDEEGTGRMTLAINTVNGEFVRRIQLGKESSVAGITVTLEGHIAVAFRGKDLEGKVTLINI